MFFWRWWLCLTVLLALLPAARAQEPAAFPENFKPTEEQVTRAIRRGVDYLLAQQKDGHWETGDNRLERIGGVTCLTLYALLHVGQSYRDEDPRLKPSSAELAGPIKYVTNLKSDGTYVVSLQANCISLLRGDENRRRLLKLRDTLVKGTRKDGGYNYFLNPKTDPTKETDSSNSQYGLLGAWAAFDADVPVPPRFWAEADRYWRDRANADGGFGYHLRGASSVSMTAAGVASLFVTTEHTDTAAHLEPRVDAHIEEGIAYLIKNYKPATATGYVLYGMERVGLASGRKFLGEANWFAEGAAHMLRTQKADGSWNFNEVDAGQSGRVSTAFALLFLARGRNPVLFNKLQYEGPWNARPRDSANLTQWMSRAFERRGAVNWQIVPLTAAVEEWMDAPVLLITGSRDPQYTPEQVAKLRQFVNEGGLIFSTADGGSKEFTEAMQRYAKALGEDKYAGRPLPKDHAVFSKHMFAQISNPPPLWGLSNSVRELWIHSPEDFGAAWQTKLHPTDKEREAGKLEKEQPWELAANIFFYANGKTLRSKLQNNLIVDPGVKPERSLTLGRVRYKGSWDPEPGAFARLARLARSRWSTEITCKIVEFDQIKDLREPKVLYMTGNGKFEYTPEQRAGIKTFLDAGGILVADALNTSREFDAVFQTMIKEMYPGERWEPLDNRSTLFIPQGLPGVEPITRVNLRPLTVAQYGALHSPRIFALTTRATPRKLRVLYSPFDLTLGYLGTNTYGFNGYTPESSTALARNILLYVHALTTMQ